MYVCAHYECLMPEDAQRSQRGHWIPWNYSNRGCKLLCTMLEIKLESSGTASGAFNCCTTSPAQHTIFITQLLMALATQYAYIHYYIMYMSSRMSYQFTPASIGKPS